MEIHAPDKHVQSPREIALHLAIVTTGILIALGLEQTVEWFHHRELVAEARATILDEVRSNKKELDTEIRRISRHRSNAIEVLDFVSEMLDHGKSDRHSVHVTFSLARLRSTSWTTAQAVGAVVFMSYADVEKYASVYRRQDDFLVAQNRTEDAVVSASGVFAAHNKFEKLSHTELEAERGRLMSMISSLTLELQLAEVLSSSYDNLLSGKTDSPSPAAPGPAAPPKEN